MKKELSISEVARMGGLKIKQLYGRDHFVKLGKISGRKKKLKKLK